MKRDELGLQFELSSTVWIKEMNWVELIQTSFIFVATKAVGQFVKIKDIEACQKELRNDYIINKELSTLAGQLALTCGNALSVASAALITAKNFEYGGSQEQQDSSPNVEQLTTMSE